LRKLKVRNLWVQNGTDYSVDVTPSLRAMHSIAQPTKVGLDDAAVYQHGTYSTALAYGPQASDHLILKSMHISVSVPATKWVFGDVNYITTSGASTGYIDVGYNYLSVGHDLVNGFASRNRVAITAGCALGEMCGVLGTMEIAAVAVTANGSATLSAGIFDTEITAGATVAQDVTCLEIRPRIRANISGTSSAIRININCASANYVDYGLNIISMSNNQLAAIRIQMTGGSAALPSGIILEGKSSSTSTITNGITFAGTITNAFDFDATDGDSSCHTTASVDSAGTDSDAAIRVDVAGVAYYIGLWNAAHTTSSF